MKRIILVLAALAMLPLRASALTDTLFISNLYTTHVVFPAELTYADLSNREAVAAKIVDRSRNVLAVRAREAFTSTASISAMDSDGQMHTYILAYREHPESLVVDVRRKERKEESGDGDQDGKGILRSILSMPQNLYHLFAKQSRVSLACTNIFSSPDVTYVTLSLRNGSGVSYATGDATFVVESRNKGKRKIVYERNLTPRCSCGTLCAAPDETSMAAYALDKVTLAPDQVLRIYVYENGGQRNLVLTLTPKDVNLAEKMR